MNLRWAQAVALRGATAHSVRWQPLVGSCLVVGALMAWQDAALDRPGRAQAVLRCAAILLAAGVVGVTDDAAAVSVAASPTPLWWRRLLRYAVAAAFALPTWVAVVGRGVERRPGLAWPRLTLELAALVVLGLAAAAVAARRSDAADPGLAGAVSVLGFAMLVVYLPPRLALFTSPDAAGWQPSTLRWTVTLLAASAVLLAATRDPAARTRWRVLRAAWSRGRRAEVPVREVPVRNVDQ